MIHDFWFMHLNPVTCSIDIPVEMLCKINITNQSISQSIFNIKNSMAQISLPQVLLEENFSKKLD